MGHNGDKGQMDLDTKAEGDSNLPLSPLVRSPTLKKQQGNISRITADQTKQVFSEYFIQQIQDKYFSQ